MPRRRRAADRAVAPASVAAARPRGRRGQAADRSAEASTLSPRLSLGAVTNLCDATSELTVEGDLPSSLAICLHEALRSSILWTVFRSCLVSLPYDLPDGFGLDMPIEGRGISAPLGVPTRICASGLSATRCAES